MKNVEIDTIAALATPSGRGGIAVIRISGPLVDVAMQAIIGKQLKPREVSFHAFKDENGETIDEGLALYFAAPHSFTGENVLELQGHGGPVVVDLLLQRILRLNIRLAKPGEFSQRAFLNEKLDLSQAEAIADLINASSEASARAAVRSLQGEFSKIIRNLSDKLVHLRMYIEASIDFIDENIDFLKDEKITSELNDISTALLHIQQKAQQGSLLREGMTAVILGEPNVGKSSLLNALSGKEIAIVTDIPGTTRDVLREAIIIDGLPLHILDTAGLRDSEDVVEREGIRRAHEAVELADMVLYVVDASKQDHVDLSMLPKNILSRFVLVIKNKIDLISTIVMPASSPSERGKAGIQKTVKSQAVMPAEAGIQSITSKEQIFPVILLSARTGEGIDLLKQQIKHHAGFKHTEGNFLARRRHLQALATATSHVQNCLSQLACASAFELAAEDLRQAHLALCEITGEFTSDDLLGKIFSSFCIGK